jgi:short-subunit dehydrogenase
MDLIRLVLPGMRARRAGRIINVSSVGGMMAMPTMAAYSASKFALEGATESLFYEVRPWNIKVSLVQPGFIHSEAYTNVRFTPESRHANDDVHAAYHAHYEHMAPFIARLMHASRATPDKVAKTIIKTMRRRWPALRVPATLDAHVFAWIRRILPRSLYHFVLYRMLPDVRRWGHDEDDLPAQLPAPAPAVTASRADAPTDR